MISAPSVGDVVKELAGTFSGQLLQPGDAGYDEASVQIQTEDSVA
jgi:hypothetical protein